MNKMAEKCMIVVPRRKLLDADTVIDVRDITHICRSASITSRNAPMGTIAARLAHSIMRAAEEKQEEHARRNTLFIFTSI